MKGRKLKPLIALIIVVAAAVFISDYVFTGGRWGTTRPFLMQGANLADLEPGVIISNIGQVTRAAEGEIYLAPAGVSVMWHVTGDFDWYMCTTFRMYTAGDSRLGGRRYFYQQLRGFPDDERFYVTVGQRLTYKPNTDFLLADILYGLKHIPQSYIQSMVRGYPCTFIITFRGDETPHSGQPRVFYNRNGVVTQDVVQGRVIRFDIQPMYQGHGIGSDLIHFFFEI